MKGLEFKIFGCYFFYVLGLIKLIVDFVKDSNGLWVFLLDYGLLFFVLVILFYY